jgi:hypothetical protein
MYDTKHFIKEYVLPSVRACARARACVCVCVCVCEYSLSGFLLDLGQPLLGHVDLGASASYELLDLCSDLKIH